MKLKEFIIGRVEPESGMSQHLFDRVVFIDGKIIEFKDDTKDIIIKEYNNINEFIKENHIHPDIKYTTLNKYNQICIEYGENKRNVYCRHSEIVKVFLEDFDTGKVTLTKKSCASCGLEWHGGEE